MCLQVYMCVPNNEEQVQAGFFYFNKQLCLTINHKSFLKLARNMLFNIAPFKCKFSHTKHICWAIERLDELDLDTHTHPALSQSHSSVTRNQQRGELTLSTKSRNGELHKLLISLFGEYSTLGSFYLPALLSSTVKLL